MLIIATSNSYFVLLFNLYKYKTGKAAARKTGAGIISQLGCLGHGDENGSRRNMLSQGTIDLE
jgi:hypothetical protein